MVTLNVVFWDRYLEYIFGIVIGLKNVYFLLIYSCLSLLCQDAVIYFYTFFTPDKN